MTRWWHRLRRHDFIRVWTGIVGVPYCYYGCVTCDKVWPTMPRDKADWGIPSQPWRNRRTEWGWSKAKQQDAEFNILAQYYSASLCIPFRRFEKFHARPWERPDRFWEITLVDYPTMGDVRSRQRTVLEVAR